jgi:DNA-binding MarR family transcriptional regulator
VSIRVMTQVFDHSQARLADRLVLLVIADRCDDDGAGCWRGRESIAQMAGVSPSQVTISIRRLREMGELEVIERPGRTNEYRIVLATLTDSARVDGDTLTESATPPSQSLRDTLTESVTDTSSNPSLNQPRAFNLVIADAVDEGRAIEQVFSRWQDAAEKPRARLDEKRRRLIGRWLDVYGEEYLLLTVVGWRHVPHNRGENDRRTVYNDLGLLLRDAEHIERFHDAAEAAGRPRRGKHDFAERAQEA